jgi:hypothetical protein
MTLLGPGVTAAIIPNTTNETKSSGSMSDSCLVFSEGHPATWILALSVKDTQVGVKLIQVDVATANVALRICRVKRGSAVHQALIIKHQHIAGMEFEFNQAIAGIAQAHRGHVAIAVGHPFRYPRVTA